MIAQGGAVGLDTVHLTNTGYAYVAREFLKKIYEADEQTGGAVLHGLPGSGRAVAEFDDEVRHVAEEDTLLNDVPTLVPDVLDFLSAESGALGGVHYADPVLAAVR